MTDKMVDVGGRRRPPTFFFQFADTHTNVVRRRRVTASANSSVHPPTFSHSLPTNNFYVPLMWSADVGLSVGECRRVSSADVGQAGRHSRRHSVCYRLGVRCRKTGPDNVGETTASRHSGRHSVHPSG